MSDESKSTPPEPAVAPTLPAAPEPTRIIENPLMSWIRGGTVSSAYQQHLDEQKANAAAARKVEDAKQAFAENNKDEAKQYQKAIGGNKAYAGIVLELRHPKDKTTVLDYIECELHVLEDSSLMLQMCCPWCFARNGTTDNFSIRQKHRHFELDSKRQGELWVNPKNTRNVVTLAGTINLTEAVTCPNLGCGKRFVIDDSVLREK